MYSYLVSVFVKSVPFMGVMILATVSFLPCRKQMDHWSSRRWFLLGVLWLALVQGDTLLLGPFARMELGDGSYAFVGEVELRTLSKENTYLHDLFGGVDKYSYFSYGGELLSIRLILNSFLPLWLSFSLIRLLVTGIAILGIVLWAKRRFGLDEYTAFASAALFSVGFQFCSGLAYQWGVGLAGVPLLAYILFNKKFDGRGSILLVTIIVLMVGLSAPQYHIPIVLASLVAIYTFVRPVSRHYLFLGCSVLVFCWVANYAEVIYGTLLTADESYRVMFNPYVIENFSDWLQKVKEATHQVFALTLTQDRGSWPYIATLGAAMAIFMFTRSGVLGLIAIFAMLYGRELLYFVPYDSLGLGFMESYNPFLWLGAYGVTFIFYLMQMSHIDRVVKVPVIFSKKYRHYLNSIMLGIALAMLAWLKYYSLRDTLFLGGIDQLTEIRNLQSSGDWVLKNSKAVGVPYRLIPASLSSYGFIAVNDLGGTLKPYRSELYIRQAFRFEYGDINYYRLQSIDIAEYVSTPLLKLAGVRYVVSMVPLSGDGITEVLAPQERVIPPRRMPNLMVDYYWIFRASWLFDRELYQYHFSDKYAYIYEVTDSLPLAYRPTSIELAMVRDDTEYISMIEQQGREKTLLVRDPDLLDRSIAEVDIFQTYRILNGYRFEIDVHSPGLLVINLPYTKWWTATVNGRNLKLVPGNFIQTVVELPKGVQSLRLTYSRPLFSSFIRGLWSEMIAD